MVSFQTKNPNLGKFRRVLDWKMLIHIMTIWKILLHLGYFMTIWKILLTFGIFYEHLENFTDIWDTL
jgi:hypothetical protein